MTQEKPGPPPSPWEKGKHDDYLSFSLKVNICHDNHGQVWSEHGFDTELDEKTAAELPNMGLEQIAYALMIEMGRRELYVDALIEMTKDKGWLDKWVKGSPEEKQKIEHELANACMSILNRTLGQAVPMLARETMMRLAMSRPPDPPSEPDPNGA